MSLRWAPGARTRDWSRLLLVVVSGTMTAAWLAVWTNLLGLAGTGPEPGEPAQGVILFAGAGLCSWLAARPLGERWSRALFALSAVLVTLIAVWAQYFHGWFALDPRWPAQLWLAPPAARRYGAILGSVAPVLALWWAGGRIGTSELDEYEAYRLFGWGVAGLFAGLAGAALASSHGPSSYLTGSATAVFFVAAFLTLPFAQIISARKRGSATAAWIPALDRSWLTPVVASAAVILLLALLLSATVSGTLLRATADGLARLPDLVLFVLQPVVFVVAYVAEGILHFLQWLWIALAGQPHKRLIGSPATQGLHSPRLALRSSRSAGAHLPQALVLVLTWGGLALATAAVAAALSRAIAGLGGRPVRSAEFEEERDSVWSWQDAGLDLRALLSGAGAFLQRRSRQAGRDALDGPPTSIRGVYRRLLRRGRALGVPRAACETPHEYLERLRIMSDPPAGAMEERDAAALTSSYVSVRYGDQPERAGDLERAVQVWQRLEHTRRDRPV